MKLLDNTVIPEPAILIGAELRSARNLLPLSASLDELERLAETAGLSVVGRVTQLVNHIDPATFVGSGKVKEILEAVADKRAKVVIFDDELSPRHQRELSRHLGNDIKLLDRSALILDIFAQHAKTREGALQVELAQYEYRLPRLTRQWTHLARQAGGGAARGGSGGVGLRGPGETQLEVDKREIGRRIAKLRADLEDVRRHRRLHRSQRRKSGIPVVALVGYTNAGKSTLLNTLSEANVYVADQLFATLDPTTRRIQLPTGREILLTDTVGFIQKLPTTLIAAFRATLEEIVEADLLLHIIDASDPYVLSNIDAVEDTLAEIDMPSVPRILVWNKSDRPTIEVTLADNPLYLASVRTSALAKTGLDDLMRAMDRVLETRLIQATLLIPYERGDILSQLYHQGHVSQHESTGRGTIVSVRIPHALFEKYSTFQVKGAQSDVSEN
jgi:GTP-binding protein HflX